MVIEKQFLPPCVRCHYNSTDWWWAELTSIERALAKEDRLAGIKNYNFSNRPLNTRFALCDTCRETILDPNSTMTTKIVTAAKTCPAGYPNEYRG